MNTRAYLDLQKKHQNELSNFPIAYAFNDEQLEKALKKLGATLDECITYIGAGDIMKKTDVPKFKEMLIRHSHEIRCLLLSNEQIAEAAFRYEMDNHEYAINWDGDDDIFSCFGIDEKWLVEMKLVGAYKRAKRTHFKHMESLGVI